MLDRCTCHQHFQVSLPALPGRYQLARIAQDIGLPEVRKLSFMFCGGPYGRCWIVQEEISEGLDEVHTATAIQSAEGSMYLTRSTLS